MKKAPLLRCTGFARSNVLPEYASARDSARASHLDLFDPARRKEAFYSERAGIIRFLDRMGAFL